MVIENGRLINTNGIGWGGGRGNTNNLLPHTEDGHALATQTRIVAKESVTKRDET